MQELETNDSGYTIIHHMALQEGSVSAVSTKNEKLQAIENWLLLNREVTERTRKRKLVDQRRMICYLLRTHTDLSLASIGKLLGGKDHATIMYGYKTHCELWNCNDQEYRFNTRELVEQFKNLL